MFRLVYWGVVGLNMSKIVSWDPIFEKFKTRLICGRQKCFLLEVGTCLLDRC